MGCEEIREQLLRGDWKRAALAEAAALHGHLETCSACRDALKEYDELREALGPISPAPEPDVSWHPLSKEGETPRTAGRIGLGPAALAACAALALVGWTLYLSGPSGTGVENGVGGSAAVALPAPRTSLAFTSAEVEQQVRLFEIVSETYDGRATWVALSDETVNLGLTAEVPVADYVVLLRLSLSRDGVDLSTADLIILPGQAARLSVPVQGMGRLLYQIHVSAEAEPTLSLWAEVVAGARTQAIAALSTGMGAGVDGAPGSLISTSGPYALEVAFAQAPLGQGTAP